MKVDLKKELDEYRARPGELRVLDVRPLQYVMVDGHGDPNAADGEYADALAALYPVSYALKFASKADLDRDYVVMPLEALWWADDMDAFTAARDKSQWDWTAMIMTPEWITPEMFEAAVAKVSQKSGQKGGQKGGGRPASLDKIRLETLEEGRCVQTLHVGAYDDEAEALAHLHHEFIPSQGLALTGRHHEVYLSDPRRVAPERLRTILRQPVVAATPT